MALSAKVGSFTTPTSTNSSYAITGVGFQPKYIYLWGNNLTADGNVADATIAQGAGTSSSNRGAVANNAWNAQGSTQTYATQDNTRVYKLMVRSATPIVEADLVSLDSDGFTLNFSVVDASNAYIVNYLAIGGTDLSNAFVGSDTGRTTTGTKAVTAPNFLPTLLMTMTASGTFTANPTTSASSMRPALGAANSTSSRVHMAGASFNGVVPSSTNGPFKRQVTTSVVSAITSSSAVSWEADLSSFDATGFTLNWTTVAATARYYYYCAFNGTMQVKTGTFSQSTGGTVAQGVTGVGFQPKAILLFSFQNAASSSIQQGLEMFIGAGTASNQRAVTWFGDQFNVSPTVSNSVLDRANIIKFYTEGTPTLKAAADLTSLDSDGFTVTWGTNDNVARQIGYIAFGAAATAATPVGKLFGSSTMPVQTVLQGVNRAGNY